ncbi:uncharacterized protein KY384_008256 [Bacidia gigantensis]|uniref:uncharacterized protein n=1 Tax=Bacidia gigantensis TaxID=2732470 RepID=UPI001D0403A8|nr:uncharacterized protein KY384_008256 [Bacidia gigantensis]KAG8526827.1 hypothetical protein KY384_008256 [Bacidia gigantensis]
MRGCGEYYIAEDESVPQDLEDFKEHFDFACNGDNEFPSQWPIESSIPGFRKFMEEDFLVTCQDVARDVLTCLEMGLALPKGVFTNCMKDRVDELRISYYPPLNLEKFIGGKQKRVWPHTDFGLITLLFQDAVGGLETENREEPGTWIPLNCESPTEMGVYISDTLAHMTNNYLRSGVHQVVSPISALDYGAGLLEERYSVALFAKADRTANVGPLEEFITPENPRRYEDLTAFDLHRKRVGQLYGAASSSLRRLCGPFVDYCLETGFWPYDLKGRKATVYDGGEKKRTGSSLRFVGECVAAALRLPEEETRHKRFRVSEVEYTGKELVKEAEKIVGEKWTVDNQPSTDLLREEEEEMGKGRETEAYMAFVIRGDFDDSPFGYLKDGFEFCRSGEVKVQRRTLSEIVLDVMKTASPT